MVVIYIKRASNKSLHLEIWITYEKVIGLRKEVCFHILVYFLLYPTFRPPFYWTIAQTAKSQKYVYEPRDSSRWLGTPEAGY